MGLRPHGCHWDCPKTTWLLCAGPEVGLSISTVSEGHETLPVTCSACFETKAQLPVPSASRRKHKGQHAMSRSLTSSLPRPESLAEWDVPGALAALPGPACPRHAPLQLHAMRPRVGSIFVSEKTWPSPDQETWFRGTWQRADPTQAAALQSSGVSLRTDMGHGSIRTEAVPAPGCTSPRPHACPKCAQ